MTRTRLGIHATLVIPSSQRELDRHNLEHLANVLDSGLSLDQIEDGRRNYASMLRRYLAGDYPPAPRGKPTTAPRDRAIAEAYVLIHDMQRDALAANRIATHCREHGVDLKAQTVERIATARRAEARASLARALAEGRTRYTRESMVEAHLADALRRAAKK